MQQLRYRVGQAVFGLIASLVIVTRVVATPWFHPCAAGESGHHSAPHQDAGGDHQAHQPVEPFGCEDCGSDCAAGCGISLVVTPEPGVRAATPDSPVGAVDQPAEAVPIGVDTQLPFPTGPPALPT